MHPSEAQIERYLTEALGRGVRIVEVCPLVGGVHHNLKVTTAAGERLVIRMLPRQLPPHRRLHPYDLALEYHAMDDLRATGLLPKVWGLDGRGEHLSTPAFVMEYIDGPTVLECFDRGDRDIAQRFAEALAQINAIPPAQVPHVTAARGVPDDRPADLVTWLADQSSKLGLSAELRQVLARLRATEPPERPPREFGNGDLNPSNFICAPDGRVLAVDWEYVGFADPINELMLLHVWPEARPLLAGAQARVDRIYCRLRGWNESMLDWYALLSAAAGVVYACIDEDAKRLERARQRLTQWSQ